MLSQKNGPTILIVGRTDYFLSGVGYYTARLAGAISEHDPIAVLLLRRLCPHFAYPGRAHVGKCAQILASPDVPVFNDLDWFWGPSAMRAWRFWRRTRPRKVILQWWSGAVLHSYLLLVHIAHRAGARIVVEFHETQDVGEARLPLVGRYTRGRMSRMLRRTDAVVVQSKFDRGAIQDAYPDTARLPIEVIGHGPFDQYRRAEIADASHRTRQREQKALASRWPRRCWDRGDGLSRPVATPLPRSILSDRER